MSSETEHGPGALDSFVALADASTETTEVGAVVCSPNPSPPVLGVCRRKGGTISAAKVGGFGTHARTAWYSVPYCTMDVHGGSGVLFKRHSETRVAETPQTPWKLGWGWRLFGTVPTYDNTTHPAIFRNQERKEKTRVKNLLTANHVSRTGAGTICGNARGISLEVVGTPETLLNQSIAKAQENGAKTVTCARKRMQCVQIKQSC